VLKTQMKKSYDRSVDILVVIFILLSLIISSLAMASTVTPETKVKVVFQQIESSFSALKIANEFTKSNIKDVLTQFFLPEVNTQYFSYKVLNKNHPKVPKELKGEFAKELTEQLINTYSNLLSKQSDEIITIGSARLSQDGKISNVNVTITGKNKTNKAVVKLLKSKDEVWQFFDIVIEGVSIIDTKQKEINSSFKRLGIESTLKHLKDINQRSAVPK
jgi:phospholipid transport system substrate-binding protein